MLYWAAVFFIVALIAAVLGFGGIAAGAAGIFLLAGVGGTAYIWLQSRNRHPIFQETIKVLKGDESGLREMLGGTGD